MCDKVHDGGDNTIDMNENMFVRLRIMVTQHMTSCVRGGAELCTKDDISGNVFIEKTYL